MDHAELVRLAEETDDLDDPLLDQLAASAAETGDTYAAALVELRRPAPAHYDVTWDERVDPLFRTLARLGRGPRRAEPARTWLDALDGGAPIEIEALWRTLAWYEDAGHQLWTGWRSLGPNTPAFDPTGDPAFSRLAGGRSRWAGFGGDDWYQAFVAWDATSSVIVGFPDDDVPFARGDVARELDDVLTGAQGAGLRERFAADLGAQQAEVDPVAGRAEALLPRIAAAVEGLDLDAPDAEARFEALGRLEQQATARVHRLRRLAGSLEMAPRALDDLADEP